MAEALLDVNDFCARFIKLTLFCKSCHANQPAPIVKPKMLVSCCSVSNERPPEAEEKLDRSPAKAAADACAGTKPLAAFLALLLLRRECEGAASAAGTEL